MEASIKTENRTTISSSNSTPGCISEENKNMNSKIHAPQCSQHLEIIYNFQDKWKQASIKG